jgi:Flp pilus assembly pilin Flp
MFTQIRDRGLGLARLLRRLGSDRRGITLVEYGVMAALILVVCVASINTLGGNVYAALFNRVAVAASSIR